MEIEQGRSQKTIQNYEHYLTRLIDYAGDIKIETIDEMKAAARKIMDLGAGKVVVKGGHLGGALATDILFDGVEFKAIESRRFDTKNTHGTGCTFSSAIAANLALGKDFFDSVARAKQFITGAIEHALPIGKGHGPTHHFYDLYAKAGMEKES